MSAESEQIHQARLRAVLEDRERHRAAGESVSDISIIAAHPDLMPELGEELRKLRIIAAAREQAFAPSVHEGEPTVEHEPNQIGSRGLHIRCPHCCNPVEVITDTPYAEICCSTCGSSFSLVDREEATRMAVPLKSIGRFDLIMRLGVGGFGTVWKARDRELDRTVAIKIPRRGQLSSAEIDQFFREARAAAQVRHPNIVPVHEVGRDGETLFIVSDFIRGVTLNDWLTGNAITAKESAELCILIAEALHQAHQQGVVHRDLKPSNIIVDESDQPHLTDFGLAKRELGEITMTIEGQILGTPSYMSPEQACGQGHWTDRRTDIYSLGVVFFRLLTGELPFRGNTQVQIQKRLTEDAPDPRTLNRHVPRDAATICLKCLEREPGRRYTTAAELASELARFLRGEPIQARPISPLARLGRWVKRKPWVASTAVLILLLAFFGPLAAIGIDKQRRQLEVRFRERNALIENSKLEIDKGKGRIQNLENQLAAWNGQATPSDFWPPLRETPPRQILIADLFDRSSTTLASQLRSGKYTAEQTARGYMALARMACAVNSPTAKEFYHFAHDALLTLRKQVPDQPRFARALAQCETRLAELSVEGNRDRASQDFENARNIYQDLATEHRSDPVSQIDWLESELKSAFMFPYNVGGAHLARTDQIKKALSGSWPNDPDGIYRVACYLSHEEPILLPPAGEAAPALGTTPITPSSR